LLSIDVDVADTGGTYRFDVEIKQDMGDLCTLAIVPKTPIRGHGSRGCVVMDFSRTPGLGSEEVVISAFMHDEACSGRGMPPLEKKSGSRAMLLGSVHAMMFLAKKRWPHLEYFTLADEATFLCEPASAKVRTCVTDLLLTGKTYYERHLNAKPVSGVVARATRHVIDRMQSSVDMSGGEFVALIENGIDLLSRRHSHLAGWIPENKDDIGALVDEYAETEQSWRALFTALNDKYGCVFFACCEYQLRDAFSMHPLVGAAYTVRFEDVPRGRMTSGLQSQSHQIQRSPGSIRVSLSSVSGGGSNKRSSYAARKRIRRLKALAMFERYSRTRT
jgi:hypothetical protein